MTRVISASLSSDRYSHSAMADSTTEAYGVSFLGYGIAVLAISAVAVAARLIGRGVSKSLWWDDWIVALALILSIVQISLYIYCNHLNIDQPDGSIGMISALSESLKLLWISNFFAAAALTTVRASALLLFTRIFRSGGRAVQNTIWMLQGLNLIWWIWSIIANALLCTPVNELWDVAAPEQCSSLSDFDLAVTVPSIVIDMAVIIFPVILLDRMRHKRLIALVLILALTAPAASLGRLVISLTNQSNPVKNFGYYNSVELFWAAAENPAGIIASSVPAIFCLCKRSQKEGSAADAPNGDGNENTGVSPRNNSRASFARGQLSPTKMLKSPISKPKLHPLYTNEGLPKEEAGDKVAALPRPSPKRKRRSFKILSLYLGNDESFSQQVRRDLHLQPPSRASPTPEHNNNGSPRDLESGRGILTDDSKV